METKNRKWQRPLPERCASTSLRLTDVLTGQQIYAFCQQRKKCRRCAEYYRYGVARSLNTVEWHAHVLLTMTPGEDSCTPTNLRHQSRSLQIFVRLLRREFQRFYYAWFRETAKEGHLHLHILWSIPAIEKNLLWEIASQSGFGHVDIQSIRKPGAKPQMAVINYVTKGLGKIDRNGVWPHGTRKYQIAAPVRRKGKSEHVWLPSV